MYSGTNPSALRSQKWILESLLSLMEEKPFDNISIKEITDRSDLSRQTFYKVFGSKEEVLEYYLDSLFSDYLSQIQTRQIHSVKELAQLYFAFYKQHTSFIDLLFQNHLSPLLVKRFEIYLPILKGTVPGQKRKMPDSYVEAFLSSGLVGILERYSTDEQTPAEALALMLDEILSGSFRSFP